LDEFIRKETDNHPREITTVNEFDALLVDNEEYQLHYVELKKDRTYISTANRQIEQAANFFPDLDWKLSASIIAYEDHDNEEDIIHRTWQDLNSISNCELDDKRNPVELNEIYPPPYRPFLRNARAPLPLEDEKFEQEKEVEEESIIDQKPPHKVYHYLFQKLKNEYLDN